MTAAGIAREVESATSVSLPPAALAASSSVAVTFMAQPWLADVSTPPSESTSASSQTGHSAPETTSGTATRATTPPDCASETEQDRVASPGPVRYAAPTFSRVGERRSGAAEAGSQAAAAVVVGDVERRVAAALPSGGVPAAAVGAEQVTRPTKSKYGQRLSHGLSLISGDASDTPKVSMPENGAALSGALNSSANGARDVLGVGDCVRDGVSDWLGVEEKLLVLDGVCDCEGDPVALAVRERLWVMEGVEVADGVIIWLGVVVKLLVPVCERDCERDPVVLAVRETLWVAEGVDEADGVIIWLEVLVRLPVPVSERDCERVPDTLAVRERLWVTEGVEEGDRVRSCEDVAVAEGVVVDEEVAVEEYEGETLGEELVDAVPVCERQQVRWRGCGVPSHMSMSATRLTPQQ